MVFSLPKERFSLPVSFFNAILMNIFYHNFGEINMKKRSRLLALVLAIVIVASAFSGFSVSAANLTDTEILVSSETTVSTENKNADCYFRATGDVPVTDETRPDDVEIIGSCFIGYRHKQAFSCTDIGTTIICR